MATVIFPVGEAQEEFVTDETKATGADGAAKLVFAIPVQPRLSVTVTVKFPEPRPVAVIPVPPEGDQE